MKFSLCNLIYILFCTIVHGKTMKPTVVKECLNIESHFERKLLPLMKVIVPELEGKKKGDAGKIGVIAGSFEYSGAPYFAAMAAHKVGADLVYIVTTESAAGIIKTYSPDLTVYPYLRRNNAVKINAILNKMDIIVIGPGLGRDQGTLNLIYDIIKYCSKLAKPLIVDADGLYAVYTNINILKNYPSPGVILTPNQREAHILMQAIPTSYSHKNTTWYSYWGLYVSVLVKGYEDKYYSGDLSFHWSSWSGGSGRRTGGQGDILAGSLATLFNWALKVKLCDSKNAQSLAHSVSAFAAAKITRASNYLAYKNLGRGLTASSMLDYMHPAFESLFFEKKINIVY